MAESGDNTPSRSPSGMWIPVIATVITTIGTVACAFLATKASSNASAAQNSAVTAKSATALQVPIGGVIAWWGNWNAESERPEGYELCDGTSVVTEGPLFRTAKPDLRACFIRGAASSGDVRPGTKGGSAAAENLSTNPHALALSEMPAHNHGGRTTGNATHTHESRAPTDQDDGGSTSDRAFALGDGTNPRPWPNLVITGGEHQHQIPLQGEGRPHAHDLPPIPTLPPFLELHYLIRVR